MHRFFLAPLTVLFAISLLFWSCSAYEPEVLGVTLLELRYLNLDGPRSQELILELEVRDEDGFSELDRVYVVQDEAELFWEFPSESWHARPAEGEIRILRLAAPGGEALPRGSYRVELFDLGGRSGEGSFTLPLLPEAGTLEALEERVLRAGGHLRELLTAAPLGEELEEELLSSEELQDIGLLFFPAGGVAPQNMLNLERLATLGPEEREELLSITLEGVAGEGGRLYLGARYGDAGPLVLLELEELLPKPVREAGDG